MRKEAVLFEKKEPKTLIHEVRDSMDKSFLLLFFKKEVLLPYAATNASPLIASTFRSTNSTM